MVFIGVSGIYVSGQPLRQSRHTFWQSTAPCGRSEQDGLDICRCSCRSPQWSCRSPRCIPWLADVLLWSSLYVGGGGGVALYVSTAHHAGEDQGAVRKRPLQRGC